MSSGAIASAASRSRSACNRLVILSASDLNPLRSGTFGLLQQGLIQVAEQCAERAGRFRPECPGRSKMYSDHLLGPCQRVVEVSDDGGDSVCGGGWEIAVGPEVFSNHRSGCSRPLVDLEELPDIRAGPFQEPFELLEVWNVSLLDAGEEC